MTASDTSYTAVWDGRDESGALAAGRRPTWYGGAGRRSCPVLPEEDDADSVGVTSVTASPNPFVPTGSNSTTITVQAAPGQTGLTPAYLISGGSNTYRSERQGTCTPAADGGLAGHLYVAVEGGAGLRELLRFMMPTGEGRSESGTRRATGPPGTVSSRWRRRSMRCGDVEAVQPRGR